MTSHASTIAAHRGIVRGMVLVGAFAMLGKVAGALKEVAVAWRFGVGAEVDAYLLVQNLLNWPVSAWLAVLTVVLVPLSSTLSSEHPGERHRFRAELLAATIILGVILMVVALVALPPLVRSSWLGLPPRTQEMAAGLVPVLAWLLVPGLLVGLYSTWMMASGRHINTLLEGVPALCILGVVLLVGGIETLAWATVAGAVAQLVALGIALRSRESHGMPALGFTARSWTPFWQGFGAMVLGQAIMGVTTLVEQFFAARLGEGAISQIGYANRLLGLVLGILATAATRATLPVFARLRAAGTLDLRGFAFQWASWLGLGAVVIAAVGWVLAPWGVKLCFERGTFTGADTLAVSSLLRHGLTQLPFYVASLVLVSLHSSNARYGLLLLSGALALAVKIASCVLLLPMLGIDGLVLSSAAVYAANVVLLTIAAWRLSPGTR